MGLFTYVIWCYLLDEIISLQSTNISYANQHCYHLKCNQCSVEHDLMTLDRALSLRIGAEFEKERKMENLTQQEIMDLMSNLTPEHIMRPCSSYEPEWMPCKTKVNVKKCGSNWRMERPSEMVYSIQKSSEPNESSRYVILLAGAQTNASTVIIFDEDGDSTIILETEHCYISSCLAVSDGYYFVVHKKINNNKNWYVVATDSHCNIQWEYMVKNKDTSLKYIENAGVLTIQDQYNEGERDSFLEMINFDGTLKWGRKVSWLNPFWTTLVCKKDGKLRIYKDNNCTIINNETGEVEDVKEYAYEFSKGVAQQDLTVFIQLHWLNSEYLGAILFVDDDDRITKLPFTNASRRIPEFYYKKPYCFIFQDDEPVSFLEVFNCETKKSVWSKEFHESEDFRYSMRTSIFITKDNQFVFIYDDTKNYHMFTYDLKGDCTEQCVKKHKGTNGSEIKYIEQLDDDFIILRNMLVSGKKGLNMIGNPNIWSFERTDSII